MDLDELRAFFAILDAGSPSAAARLSGMPRATLRRRLAELEARVGAPLLARAAEGLVPTRAGELLAERGRPLLARHAALLQSAAARTGEQGERLRLGLVAEVPLCALAPLVEALRAGAAGAELRLSRRERPHEQLFDDLDAAVTLDERAPGAALVALPLGWLEEGAWISPLRAEPHGPPQRLDELAEHPLAHWGAEEDEVRWPTWSGAPVPVRCAAVAPEPGLVEALVRGGFGVGWLPSAVAGGLLPVLPGLLGRRRPVTAWVHADLRGTRRVELLAAAAQRLHPTPLGGA